jgi:pectin methylesterase-like acyl-CoA thioesterase
MTRVAAVASLVLGFSLSLASTAWGATRVVDDDGVQCPAAAYHTIQAAVDAASSGDTVLVCNGLYPEHVTIPAGKDNLRLLAKAAHGAIVRSTNPITVDGASQARIERFVLEGDGPTAGVGVGVGNASGGSIGSTKAITGNLIRRVRTGVFLDDTQGGDISHNTIQEFASAGVSAESPSSMSLGATGNVSSNTIIGTTGSVGVAFQQDFGSVIQVGGTVAGNVISGNAFNGIGIDVVNANVDVKNNEVFDNGTGVQFEGVGTVQHNHVSSNEGEGIVGFGTGNTFRSNDARGNGAADCEDAGSNTWTGNRGLDAVPPSICTPGAPAAGPAPTSTRLVVDDDHAQCPHANYTSIQSAVDAADPGDTVLVCDGLYREDVTIPDGTDRLRVISNVKQRAVVRSFTISGAIDVEISRFVIEGTGGGAGISVVHGANGGFGRAAAIRDNLIRRVDTGIDLPDTVALHVERNRIQEFSSTGIDLFAPPNGLGSFADGRSNTLIGTPTSTGLHFDQAGFVASVDGQFAGNDILGNGVAGVSSTNALTNLTHNRVFGNGDGIDGDFQSLRSNLVYANTGKGLSVRFVHTPIRSNDARGNGGLDCEDNDSNTWIGNRGLDASPPGICHP